MDRQDGRIFSFVPNSHKTSHIICGKVTVWLFKEWYNSLAICPKRQVGSQFGMLRVLEKNGLNFSKVIVDAELPSIGGGGWGLML